MGYQPRSHAQQDLFESTATEQPAAGPARGRAAGAGRPHDRVDPGAAHFRTLGTDS